MTIVYEKLLALKIPDVVQSYTEKDCMLYALGVGVGFDPTDEQQLGFVYEKNLKVLPTMAAVIGYPGLWVKELDTGIDWIKAVAGEYDLTLHRTLEPHGTIRNRMRVLDVVDKGPGKGALIYAERILENTADNARVATIVQTTFCRADGGFGGPPREQRPVHAVPERAPDLVCDLPTRPEAALVYRLSADRNPLHAEPAIARAAGFPRPILHGLATFGVAGHALLKSLCGYGPARLAAIKGRFSAPVFPGETIRTEMWDDGGGVVSFRARVLERDVVALNNGRAEIKAAS
jgi:acyl dehydratase